MSHLSSTPFFLVEKKSLNHSSRSLSVILYMYKTLSRHSDSLGYVVASFGSLRMCKGAQHPASNGDRDGVGREGRHSGPAKWELQETVAKEGGGGERVRAGAHRRVRRRVHRSPPQSGEGGRNKMREGTAQLVYNIMPGTASIKTISEDKAQLCLSILQW